MNFTRKHIRTYGLNSTKIPIERYHEERRKDDWRLEKKLRELVSDRNSLSKI
jgi:hypothetical protein